ncbi:MAG: hypothetical protein LKF82_06985 [Acinetobacter populi]|jgi:hypothetical protein|uniref:hypothetical protein n=1 Tax=Acinetobacter populi TaxID=1582270 RepID=UPI002356D6B4|nr:hypothetical protein [Acinetobacter populi]MCH4247569.1 hypothetical protein [Acinetobacter populi]
MKTLDVSPYYLNVNVKDQAGLTQAAKLLIECREEEYVRKNAKSWFFKNHYLVWLEVGILKSISNIENHFTMTNGEIYTLL